MESDNKNRMLLAEALLSLRTPEEMLALLEDLTTPKELTEMANRFAIARMLDEDMTFKKIESVTHSSSATISRVNRCLKNGSGYRNSLNNLKSNAEK